MLHALLFTVSAACPAAQNRHRPQKRRQKQALPPQAAAPCGQPFCVTVSLRQSIRQVTAPATPGCGPPSGHGPMLATPQTATPSDSACRPSGHGLTAPAPQEPVPLAAHAPAHTPDIRQCLAACALPRFLRTTAPAQSGRWQHSIQAHHRRILNSRPACSNRSRALTAAPFSRILA